MWPRLRGCQGREGSLSNTLTPRRRGRPRTGTLELGADGYWARLTIDVNGKPKRRWFALGTHDKRTAKHKMTALLRKHADGMVDVEALAKEAGRAETYTEAVERVLAKREADGYRDLLNERILQERHIAPVIGEMGVTAIRPHHVRAVLEHGLEKRLSRGTLAHLRSAMGVVFRELYQEGVIAQNPARGVGIPRAARNDRRERAVLTDEELAAYLATPLSEMARYEQFELACCGSGRCCRS